MDAVVAAALGVTVGLADPAGARCAGPPARRRGGRGGAAGMRGGSVGDRRARTGAGGQPRSGRRPVAGRPWPFGCTRRTTGTRAVARLARRLMVRARRRTAPAGGRGGGGARVAGDGRGGAGWARVPEPVVAYPVGGPGSPGALVAWIDVGDRRLDVLPRRGFRRHPGRSLAERRRASRTPAGPPAFGCRSGPRRRRRPRLGHRAGSGRARRVRTESSPPTCRAARLARRAGRCRSGGVVGGRRPRGPGRAWRGRVSAAAGATRDDPGEGPGLRPGPDGRPSAARAAGCGPAAVPTCSGATGRQARATGGQPAELEHLSRFTWKRRWPGRCVHSHPPRPAAARRCARRPPRPRPRRLVVGAGRVSGGLRRSGALDPSATRDDPGPTPFRTDVPRPARRVIPQPGHPQQRGRHGPQRALHEAGRCRSRRGDRFRRSAGPRRRGGQPGCHHGLLRTDRASTRCT